MPTFFTQATLPANLPPDAPDDARRWTHYILRGGDFQVVFDQEGASHGGPGLSFCAHVDEAAAEKIRHSADFMRGVVFELSKSLDVQLAERRDAERQEQEKAQGRADAQLERRVRAIVREELARAGVAPAEPGVRAGTPLAPGVNLLAQAAQARARG
jgi:hypothetical protein